jgi:transcriptional regulator with XRE-family HTH domain
MSIVQDGPRRKRGSKPDKYLDRPPDPIAVQLRRAREALGWSLEKAAEKTGIPVPVLGSWERGDRHPTIGKLRDWAAAFGYELQIGEPGKPAMFTLPAEPVDLTELWDATGRRWFHDEDDQRPYLWWTDSQEHRPRYWRDLLARGPLSTAAPSGDPR